MGYNRKTINSPGVVHVDLNKKIIISIKLNKVLMA